MDIYVVQKNSEAAECMFCNKNFLTQVNMDVSKSGNSSWELAFIFCLMWCEQWIFGGLVKNTWFVACPASDTTF